MWKNNRVNKMKWMPLPRKEAAQPLNNPYCGLYSIFRFSVQNAIEEQEKLLIEKTFVDSGYQLCLLEINLFKFNECSLSEEALKSIEEIFQMFTLNEKQMIVRFVYDWEGKGVLNEPKDIEIILNHMQQLSGLLKKYTEYIYILQGLFIGSWGEMHNTRYLTQRSITRLARQLYECSGEKTQIALRCPSFWRMVFRTYQPLDSRTAFTDIQKARFSLFNDAITASETDFGTYGEISSKEAGSYGDKWIRREELEFQNNLCRYVSNGGEVINKCHYNDAGPGIETLKEMRVSYLHSIYDKEVLDKWKSVKSGMSDALWKDKSAFEYITAHLGYRFTIEGAELSFLSGRRGSLKAVLKIVNRGFAPCYHKFIVKFIVRTASFSMVKEYEADTDTRMWMPDEQVELETLISLDEPLHKEYTLSIGVYDDRMNRPIQLANTFSSADHTGCYSLGNFIVGKR